MSGSTASERELFLVGLMRQSLDAYERGDSGLGRLVADVESVLDALGEISHQDWVEELRSTWSGLEIVYAIALDQGRPSLTDEERGNVNDTITELRSLLDARTST